MGRGVTPFTSALCRRYQKDVSDLVKRCMTWEVEGIRQRGCPIYTWDCVMNNMESLGLSQKDAQFNYKWRRVIKGATG